MTNKPLVTVLKGERVDPVPFWFMRQAGRYLPEYRELRKRGGSFLDLVYSPELAAEITLQPLRRYGMSAAILFSDILVIPDALGQGVRFEEGRGPVLDPIRNPDELDRLQTGNIRSHLRPVAETVRQVRENLPSEAALIGFAGAPWTVTTYMVEGGGSPDHAKTKAWARQDRSSFSRLVDILVEATTDYLLQQVEAGAEAIQLFDSWAGSLSPDEYEPLVFEPMARLTEALHRHAPGVPVIGFPKGIGEAVAEYVAHTSVDAVSLGPDVGVDWAAEVIQPRAVVQGNLDPALLLGDEKNLLEAAGDILAALNEGPHVFNLGHGITPDVKPETIGCLSDYLKMWKGPTA